MERVMIPKGWEPGWPKWKTQARAAQERARAVFLPGRHGLKGMDGRNHEVMSLTNGQGKLPTYYVRRIRRDDNGDRATPTFPWRKIT